MSSSFSPETQAKIDTAYSSLAAWKEAHSRLTGSQDSVNSAQATLSNDVAAASAAQAQLDKDSAAALSALAAELQTTYQPVARQQPGQANAGRSSMPGRR